VLVCCIAIAAMAATASLARQPPPAPGEPPTPRRSGPIFHLHVAGPIDCAKVVADIQASLDEAKALDAPLVVLELSGNDSRLDLIWRMAIALRESTLPMCGYIADPRDRQVGPGQLTLALLTNACFIAPGTTIRSTPGVTLTDLAPGDTPWDAITTETQDWLARRLRARGVPAHAEQVITSPTSPSWMTYSTGSPTIITEPPATPSKPPDLALVFDREGTLTLELPFKAVLDLRLATEATSWMSAARKAGVRTAARVQRTHASGLESSMQRAIAMLDEAESRLIEVDNSLSLPLPREASIAPSRYRQQAIIAARAAAVAQSTLARLEQLLADYPELLRRAAPGQTSTAGSAGAYAARWRTLIQSRRDRLSRFESTIRQYETIPD